MDSVAIGAPATPRFSVKKCAWLCLPALLIGAILRISLIAAVPEAYYGGDSNSYFNFTKQLVLKGKLELEAKRRYLYPLMLTPMPFLPGCNMPQAVAVVQHLVGLGVIFGIGWVTGNVVRRPALWVPPVTILASMWPRMLWYEHEVIAEAMMIGALVWAVALAVPVTVLRGNRQRLFWFLFAAMIMIAIKPHGRPFWLGLVLVAAAVTRNPFAWGWKCYAVLAVSVFVLLSGGSGSQGAWLFLNSTLPFVRTEGAKWAEYREVLRPQIEKAHADLPNYAFHQSHLKKMLSSEDPNGPLGPVWAELASDDKKYSKVAKTLAREAVLSNPIGFSQLVLRKIALAFSADKPGIPGDPGDPVTKMVPGEFWQRQVSNDEKRWKTKPAEMRLVWEKPDYDAYLRMVQERSTRVFRFEPQLQWLAKRFIWTEVEPGEPSQQPSIRLMPLAWLALFGLVTCWLPWRAIPTSIVWLPAVLYIGLVFSVGGPLSRYLQPVEWMAFVMIALGLDAVLDGVVWVLKRMRANQGAQTVTAAR